MRSKFLTFFAEECNARGIDTLPYDDGRPEWRMEFRTVTVGGVNLTIEPVDESAQSELATGLFILNLSTLFAVILPDVAERFQAAALAAYARLQECLKAAAETEGVQP